MQPFMLLRPHDHLPPFMNLPLQILTAAQKFFVCIAQAIPMLQEEDLQLVDRAQRPWYLMFMIQRWLMLVLDFVIMCLAVLAVGVAVGF
ncbi:hypothetical protein BDR22DRAFT_855733 [Usnea florida]